MYGTPYIWLSRKPVGWLFMRRLLLTFFQLREHRQQIKLMGCVSTVRTICLEISVAPIQVLLLALAFLCQPGALFLDPRDAFCPVHHCPFFTKGPVGRLI